MTEIKIEKKQPVWPWILLVLGFLIAAWFFLFRDDKAEIVETADKTALLDLRENNSIVANYVAFINSGANAMSLDHAYSSEALIKLTDAVDAMASETGYDVKVDIAKAKQYAEEITRDPLVTTHADKIRSAADLLSTALQNMQTANYPSLSNEAADVKSAAEAINPEVLTLDQQDAVTYFFKKAADLLNKMN